jgi:hypothetical protein
MTRHLNGKNGLTSEKGLTNGKAPRPTKEVILAAVVTPGCRVLEVRFKGDRVHLTLPVVDVVNAAAEQGTPRRRKQRVVVRDPHSLEGTRIPPTLSSPRWW